MKNEFIFTNPEVGLDNKKVFKLFRNSTLRQKMKAIVVDEAHLAIDW